MIKRSVILIVAALLLLLPQTELLAKKRPANGKRSKQSRKISKKRRQIRFVPTAGIYVETLDGEALMEQNSVKLFNPASVMKIATSYTALNKLGFDYRFATDIYANGYLENGSLVGDLIIAGNGDPGFYTESAFLLAEKLQQVGISSITGDLLIISPFYFNFNASSLSAGEQLQRILTGNWGPALQSDWSAYQKGANRPFQAIQFGGRVRVINKSEIDEKTTLLFTHKSLPLIELLKRQNDFSNNFMAEVVGHHIGGPGEIASFLRDKVKIPATELKVVSASGLGNNLMTPHAALMMMRSFYFFVKKNGHHIEELLPIAGIDQGTLEERFLSPEVRGSVIAKTGTLANQGVSALVGVGNTREKGLIVFAVLNRDRVYSARHKQESIVVDILYSCGGPLPLASTSTLTSSAYFPEIVVLGKPARQQ